MTCGQLPLGGCGNPDLTHDGKCSPWPPPPATEFHDIYIDESTE